MGNEPRGEEFAILQQSVSRAAIGPAKVVWVDEDQESEKGAILEKIQLNVAQRHQVASDRDGFLSDKQAVLQAFE